MTDHGEGDHTDFILSPRGFSMLALPNMAADLLAFGVVGIEYRRVPCQYPNSNLLFKVHEDSRFPDYLAIVMLYQAGLSDITAVEIWQVRIRLEQPGHLLVKKHDTSIELESYKLRLIGKLVI